VQAEEAPQKAPAPQVYEGGKVAAKWQIMLSGNWKDYGEEEDRILKRAYLVGHHNAKFHLRGQDYEYSFTNMVQKNLGTDKERKIRPPRGMKAPAKPLLPAGPMVVITVPPGGPGTTIEIEDPNNPGQKLQVNVPPTAKVGQKMAVPVPAAGESVEDVQAKQTEHSTAAKVALGVGAVAAVGGLAVGGVILGDHLAGGALADAAGDIAAGAADDAGGLAGDALEAAGDLGGDIGDVVADGIADAGLDDAAADAGEALADFGEEGVDWLADAGEDVGGFIMDMF